jgi:hypothetical protein
MGYGLEKFNLIEIKIFFSFFAPVSGDFIELHK